MIRQMLSVFAACNVALLAMTLQDSSSTTELRTPDGARGDRYYFEVVESFDARYLGDTPGHKGKHGQLKKAPKIALGDPVYRGTETVGHLTEIYWKRANGSLELEFDPVPEERIFVGDELWLSLKSPQPSQKHKAAASASDQDGQESGGKADGH